jgi:hypothetical protein
VVEVLSLFGDVLFINQAALDRVAEFEELSHYDYDLDADEPVEPGVFEFDVPFDEPAIVFVGTRLTSGADMAFSATTPVHVMEDDDHAQHIVAGDRVEGALDFLNPYDTYLIDLDAGEAVEIFVGSPSADLAFFVGARGERLADAFYSDDTGGGLYGSDARDVFDADKAGEYVIYVTGYAGGVAGYVLRVEPTS